MNDLENFRATADHRRPGRILCHAGFTPDLRRRVVDHVGTDDVGAHYDMWRQVGVGLRRPEGAPEIDYAPYWAGQDLPEGTTFDGFGVAMVPSGFFHFWGYVSPLRNAASLKDIEDYPLEDLRAWDDSHLAGEVAAAHAAGSTAVGWVGHMYETAWQIRGYEPFLMDMIERPAWADCLLQRLADRNRIKARALARAGVDLVRCGDDVANQKALMFQPDMWHRMMLSRWADIWAEVKAIHPNVKIHYHSDGNVTAIIPDLLDAGLDILNPVQPECLDVDAIHAAYGRRLTFDGCVGTQSTMPWGTPAEVRARVAELIAKYGRAGGLILSPTHVLEPEVPLANIDAFFDACREYGTFD